MRAKDISAHLTTADIYVCEALDLARKLAAGTYQDCFDTTEVEALRLVIDLLELRDRVLQLERRTRGEY